MEANVIIHILRNVTSLSLILESIENDRKQKVLLKEILFSETLSKEEQIILENSTIMKNFLDQLWMEIFEQMAVLDERLFFNRTDFLNVEIANEKLIEKLNIENNTFDLIQINYISEYNCLLKIKDHFKNLKFYFDSTNLKDLDKVIQLNYGLVLLNELIEIFQKFISLED